jgi:DNA-binding NarL/FixJ family response regulator
VGKYVPGLLSQFDCRVMVTKLVGHSRLLILLDIGLPTLTGLEAARQIRKRAPESRIIFVSQESSADVVQEALKLGARAYVLKIRAAIDLLATVEAVLECRQFVSGGLSGHDFTDARPRPPADY